MYSVKAEEVLEGGFYLGGNITKMRNDIFPYDPRWGFQLGGYLRAGTTWIQFLGALEYSNTGTKYKSEGTFGLSDGSYSQKHTAKNSSSNHYIALPLQIAIGYWDTEDELGGITISGGGYIEYGVVGDSKLEFSLTDYKSGMHEYSESLTHKYNTFGDKQYQLKRFDVGWMIGLQIGVGPNVRLGTEYRKGLLNLSSVDGLPMKKSCWCFNLIIGFPSN